MPRMRLGGGAPVPPESRHFNFAVAENGLRSSEPTLEVWIKTTQVVLRPRVLTMWNLRASLRLPCSYKMRQQKRDILKIHMGRGIPTAVLRELKSTPSWGAGPPADLWAFVYPSIVSGHQRVEFPNKLKFGLTTL